MSAPAEQLLVSPAEAARRLGLVGLVKDPKRVVLELARKGRIRSVRLGKHTLIDPRSLESLARRR